VAAVSVFFFVRSPVSVTRMNRESVTALTAFFFSDPNQRITKNRPRSLPPSAGFRKCSEKIECGVVCLPFVLERDALMLERDARTVFLVKELGN